MELALPETNSAANQLARLSRNLHIRYMIETRETPQKSSDISPETNTTATESLDEPSPSLLEQIAHNRIIQSQKRILESDLIASLEQTLHPAITAQNLAQMRQWKETNTDAYIIAYRNLLDQLNRAYTLLDITQPTTQTDSLSAGIHVANNLISYLDTHATLPPSLRSSLLVIVNGLSSLQAPQKDDSDIHNTAPDLPDRELSLPENPSP